MTWLVAGKIFGYGLIFAVEYFLGKRKEKDPEKSGSMVEALCKVVNKK